MGLGCLYAVMKRYPTEKQTEAMRVALEQGYFEIPRNASLKDLADQMDVSAQAVNHRLRRGKEIAVMNQLEHMGYQINE